MVVIVSAVFGYLLIHARLFLLFALGPGANGNLYIKLGWVSRSLVMRYVQEERNLHSRSFAQLPRSLRPSSSVSALMRH
jgi:hypothetical protein